MNNTLIANLSMLYTDEPMLRRFHAASEHGFSGVEIQFPYEWSSERLKHAADDAQVQIHLINVPAADLLDGGRGLSCHYELQDEFRRACAKAMEYAVILGAKKVNVLAGNLQPNDNKDDCLDCYIENITYAAELFMSEGIQVCFEAINNLDMPDYLYSSFSEMLDIYHRVSHPNAGMQYDIYHMARMNEDIASQLMDNADQIGHIQFADCPGRGAPKKKDGKK
jgi:hydroxypyruvate isomerase